MLCICLIILFLLITNSSIVISGASYGLMLWYKNILPMLLPFMLISELIVNYISNKNTKKTNNISSIGTTILLGVLCGYPVGAKTCADFVKRNSYSKKTGNLLLPLCNNSSPMFISGYIVYRILNERLSLGTVLLIIYAPYIMYITIILLCRCITQNKTKRDSKLESIPLSITISNQQTTAPHNKALNNYLINVITQITLVGVYIMLCSIAIEFINCIPNITVPFSQIISGTIEITRGVQDISAINILEEKIKIALIISLTSFGGISSILQTKMVIENTGLSIIYYTVVKIICALLSYVCCILFI